MDELKVSKTSQTICDNILISAAKQPALYQLAKKDKLVTVKTEDGEEREVYENIQALVEFNEMQMLPPGYGSVDGEPSEMVRFFTDVNAENVQKIMDTLIIDQVYLRNQDETNIIEFKKCLTTLNLKQAALRLGGGTFRDCDGDYLICATSLGRLDTLVKQHDWEDELYYMDRIDRPLYRGEYGRIKIRKDLNVVFLTSGDDELMSSLVLGPDAIIVTPVDGNLHATFGWAHTPEIDAAPCMAVGWSMMFGARADYEKCVILQATKAIEKPEEK